MNDKWLPDSVRFEQQMQKVWRNIQAQLNPLQLSGDISMNDKWLPDSVRFEQQAQKAWRDIQTRLYPQDLFDALIKTSDMQRRIEDKMIAPLRNIQKDLFPSKAVSGFNRLAKEHADRIAAVNPIMDFVRNNRAIMDSIDKQKIAIDQIRRLSPLQDVQDRISRLTSFSGNFHPFVEKHAEDLFKEKVVSKQEMTDEEKKQIKDFFKELENEEVADEVEFLERFWRKVVEGWGAMPDWLKSCLVTIIWSILYNMYFSAYLTTVPQTSHQADGPPPSVHKPVVAMIKKVERQGFRIPSECRIVIAKVLNVRESPTRHSGIRGKLLAGDLVVIIKKKKNWCLVEYSNEKTHVEIQGWVFTRYLRKINR